jgi:hypothetical protein
MRHIGLMTDIRRSNLDRTGHPKFKCSTKSKSLETSQEFCVPSDIHMFWEIYTQGTNIVDRLNVILVGNPVTPDLTEYSKTTKLIYFHGHYSSIQTALQMACSLEVCKHVEFYLGAQDQLPIPMVESNMEQCVNSSVTSLKVVTTVSQSNPVESQDMKKIVLSQIETVLKRSVTAFPELTKLSLDIPDDGKYLDLVKECIPKWKQLKHTHSVTVLNGKIKTALVNAPPPRPKIVPVEKQVAENTGQQRKFIDDGLTAPGIPCNDGEESSACQNESMAHCKNSEQQVGSKTNYNCSLTPSPPLRLVPIIVDERNAEKSKDQPYKESLLYPEYIRQSKLSPSPASEPIHQGSFLPNTPTYSDKGKDFVNDDGLGKMREENPFMKDIKVVTRLK